MNFITKNDLYAFMNKYPDEPEPTPTPEPDTTSQEEELGAEAGTGTETEGTETQEQTNDDPPADFDGPDTYCKSAMEQVADYLGYDPELQAYTQVIKGDGGTLAALQAMPVNSITALSIDGAIGDPTTLEVEKMNYICFKDNSVFQKGSRYSITFTAGYESVPDIIKTTALQIASLLWESAGGNLAVSSQTFADTGSRVFNNFTADRFLKQIAKYKRYF